MAVLPDRILTLFEHLAFRAKMCSALAYNDALDDRPTHGTGLALTSIDPEMILEVTAAINPVNAGSITENTFRQYLSNGHP
jgi:hypothetical protein